MSEQQQPSAIDTDARATLIRQLFAADRGRKPDEATVGAYLLAVRRMETPRLARVVERILEGITGDAEPYRVPQPGTLWRVAREMQSGRIAYQAQQRKPPPMQLEPTEPEAPEDGWTRNANDLLLAWITDPKARRAARYAPDSYIVPSGPPAHPGKLTILYTGILRKWSLLWARDMRDDRAEGGCLDGRALWASYMEQADREIDSHREAA